MYREMFEKYYPKQSEMIVAFWMPNKAWKGCDVKDPLRECSPTTEIAEYNYIDYGTDFSVSFIFSIYKNITFLVLKYLQQIRQKS